MTTASSVGVVIAGAVASVVVAWIGYVGAQRAKKADTSVAVLAEMREWVDDIRDSEHDCREELAALRSELGQLRQKLAAALRKLDDQQREIDRLERMMARKVGP